MFTYKKLLFTLVSAALLLAFSACSLHIEQNENMVENSFDDDNEIGGTMLAGQESPKQSGIIKSSESSEEIVITIDGKDTIYRLSEDAKMQLETDEVVDGDEVMFTTYSIGDGKKTIDRFQTND